MHEGDKVPQKSTMASAETDNVLLTGMENSMSFRRVWESHDDITDFLYRHAYIPVRSTNVSIEEAQTALNIYADIDGVTIEWNNIAATTHVFHHLFLIPRGKMSLKPVYPWLKKHENLSKYTLNSRKVFRDCVGAAIFTDSGWEYVLSLLPYFGCKIPYDKDPICRLTFAWITEVKEALRLTFLAAVPTGIIRQTLDKNNINDLKQIFILPGDCVFVLGMLQNCLDSVATPQGFRKVLFSYRFGEKNREPVYFPIAESAAVSKICIHVGVSLESSLVDESLFWSRTGLEQLIGNRGTLTTACSLHECANYQSNLDGRALGVNGDLKAISIFPETVQFVQLYADLPHCYPKTRYHPVSAGIIICQGLRSASETLKNEGKEYISVIRSNFMKMTKSVCRIEFVMSLPVLTDSVHAMDFISSDRLTYMLNKYALIVPFSTDHYMNSFRRTGLHLCDTLENLLDEYKGTCYSASVWQAYQYELAAEKLLWGHPLTYFSNQCAVNLGPGLNTPSRCATDQFGFLRLEDKFACCADEQSTPPLKIYSQSQCVQKQLSKVFGFWDYVDGSYSVVGRRLVKIILMDLYDIGSVFALFGTFVSSLKQGGSLRVVGVISKSTLAKQLGSVEKCKFPMVYICLLNMLRRKKKDVEKTIAEGLEELKLCYFPAIRNRDQHGHQCLYWHFTYGVWAIRDLRDVKSNEMTAILLCAQVVCELERRKLCFTSSIYGNNESFPWVQVCLRKLEDMKLDDQALLTLMTFVTCLVFLESGRFVDYNRLVDLHDQLPVTQYRLRQLEIQGKLQLNQFNKFMLWRLHHSIPRQPGKTGTGSTDRPTMETRIINESEETSTELDQTLRIDESKHQEQTIGNDSIRATVTQCHLPTNHVGRWNSQELAILHNLHAIGTQNEQIMTIYTKYQAECRSLNIPDRSFEAFRRKFRKL